MKNRIAVAIVILLASVYPVAAITLNGSVEKSESPQKSETVTHHRTWWQKLFGPEPEGRIGVRISTAGRIGYVHPHSPAEQAGLKTDDVVQVVDGRKHDIDDISGDPGTMVHLVVQRDTDQFAVDVKRVDYRTIPR